MRSICLRFFQTVRFLNNIRFLAILVSGIVFIGIGLNDSALAAQTVRRSSASPTVKKEKYISTVLTPEGIRILKVNYPCDRHANTSVEVRLLAGKAARNPQFVNPVFFEHTWMQKKDVLGVTSKDTLEQCYWQDEDDHVVRRLHFENPRAEVDILASVGVFQVRDTTVRIKMENPKTREMETTLIFPNASRIQVGAAPSKADPFSDFAFGFDLIAPEFSQPCDITVWVLRGDKIMLEETLHWDGHMEKPYEEKETAVQTWKKSKKKKSDFFDDDGDDDDDDDGDDDGDDDEDDDGDDDDDGDGDDGDDDGDDDEDE